LLENLSECLNDAKMRELNYKVDEERLKAEDVAHEFLVDNDLI